MQQRLTQKKKANLWTGTKKKERPKSTSTSPPLPALLALTDENEHREPSSILTALFSIVPVTLHLYSWWIWYLVHYRHCSDHSRNPSRSQRMPLGCSLNNVHSQPAYNYVQPVNQPTKIISMMLLHTLRGLLYMPRFYHTSNKKYLKNVYFFRDHADLLRDRCWWLERQRDFSLLQGTLFWDWIRQGGKPGLASKSEGEKGLLGEGRLGFLSRMITTRFDGPMLSRRVRVSTLHPSPKHSQK